LPRAERGLLFAIMLRQETAGLLMERVARQCGPRQERETEMTFDEEKRGWAFAGAEGLEKRIAACEKLAETEAQREELASMRRRLAEIRGK
jgi:hypothetical protein